MVNWVTDPPLWDLSVVHPSCVLWNDFRSLSAVVLSERCLQTTWLLFVLPLWIPNVPKHSSQALKAHRALACSKDLICSRGLVAVSKWPVETLKGTRPVINGESNLTSGQKTLSFTGSHSPSAASLPADYTTALYTYDSCLTKDSHPVLTIMHKDYCGLFIQLTWWL